MVKSLYIECKGTHMDKINGMIEQLRKKDYSSFDAFYDCTKKHVFFAIIHIVKDHDLAEDIMQDTYVRFLEKIDQYKKGQNPYAYLSTIGRNLAINEYHKRKRIVTSEAYIETIPSEPYVEDDDFFTLLSGLDDQSKEVVTLHIVNDLKFREIAKIMDKPLGTVQWLYHRALKELREKIGETDER